jgi:hypothetical protein
MQFKSGIVKKKRLGGWSMVLYEFERSGWMNYIEEYTFIRLI